MPKALLTHANERIDKVDLDFAALFGRNTTNMAMRKLILDQQDRLVSGFRVELPDQTSNPGRVVIHGGYGLDRDGNLIFNEAQIDITRDIILEGSNTTFYLEVEFFEPISDVDARAFWDPTVDQGTDPSGDPKPYGQEFFANVAARKTPDWRIVQPVSTTGFQRDAGGTVSSTRIPLLKVATDALNEITLAVNVGLAVGPASTILLERISSTVLRVQEASFFFAGHLLTVDYGGAGAETATIATVDPETGVVTLTGALIGTPAPGAIIRGDTGATQFIEESKVGRYRRPSETNVIDYRDRMFQGDEVHGDILNRGHDSITDKTDLNLRSLKDYVDYLSAQIEDMKWGSHNPWDAGLAATRVPPGLQTALPTVPRHYHKSGGIMGARTAAITVGDGVNSWGDFNGNLETALQAAHDALPASGGRIFLKRGVYGLANDFDWTSTGSVVLEGEEGTQIVLGGGKIHIATTGSVTLKNLAIYGFTTYIGILVDTANPSGFVMQDVFCQDAAFNLNAVLPGTSTFRRVWFWGTIGAMASIPLFKITGANGTISGTFTECDFNHLTMISLSCSLIDCINGAPTAGLSAVNFQDCSFASALLNAESIHLGNSGNIIHFDRCLFWSWLTVVHVRMTGGTNVKFTNCVGMDNFAGFLAAENVDHLEVSGYLNNNAVAFPVIDLYDCSGVKIVDGDFAVSSGSSLGNACIKITSQNESLEDILIESNSMTGPSGANQALGILFVLNSAAARTIGNVKIIDNDFTNVEAGVYFANPLSAAVGIYRNVIITGNEFRGSTTGVAADSLKVGLLFGDRSQRQTVTISDNIFDGVNPDTTTLAGGIANRSAICILGTSNYQFRISGNQIYKVGATGFEIADTCGIYATQLGLSTIVDNVIQTVIGVAGFGIRIVTDISNSKISDNVIFGCTSSGGSGLQSYGWGIQAESALNVTITGNEIGACYGSGIFGIAIGGSSSTGSWVNVSITGNTATGTFAAQLRMVNLSAQTVSGITISSNTGYLTEIGIAIISLPGSLSYNNIQITENSIIGDAGVWVNLTFATTDYRNVSVNGNSLQTYTYESIVVTKVNGLVISKNNAHSTAAKHNIYCQDCTKSTITGNYLHTIDGATIYNVHLGSAGNVVYLVGNNVCDRSGGIVGQSIFTSGSGNSLVPTGANGQGLICDNLIKTACVANPGDMIHDTNTLFP